MMKTFLQGALLGLYASSQALSVPHYFIRDASDAGSATTPAPASAQAQPYYKKYFVNGTTAYVPPPSTNLATVIYTMSNANGAANSVYSYRLNSQGATPDGKINVTAPVGTHPTGGNGLAFTYTGNVIQDALDSQGSLVQVGARIFAVNAGSNTVSTWAVNCTDPTKLIQFGKPVAVNGNNPSTIGVAIANKIMCVATTGINAGIECYTFSASFGSVDPPQPITNGAVPLNLPVAQNTNTPVGPADTVSQLLFTDDEQYLIAIVKSQVNTAGTVTNKGYINVYPVTSNGIGTAVKSTPAGTALLFGCTLQFDTYNLFCSDAGIGAVFLTSQSDLTYKVTHSTPTASFGNGTNCWAQRSPYKNAPNYVAPVDKNYIASFNNTNGQEKAFTNFATSNEIGGSNPNLIELQTANNYIYGLSFGNKTYGQHILVSQDTNLNGAVNSVQNFPLGSQNAPTTTSVDGLAVFIPGDEQNICDFI